MNPSERIDQLIAELSDWRGELLADVRRAMLAADPEIVEEWKWMGSPTWSRDGVIAVANAHKDKVKVTFAQGAHLEDPDRLFNAGLDGNVWRAIDFLRTDKVNPGALTSLVRAAADHNRSKRKKKAPVAARSKSPEQKEAPRKGATRGRGVRGSR